MFGGGAWEALAASIAGVCVQALLLWLARTGINRIFSRLAGAALVFAIRCLSAHYRWNLPKTHD